MRLVGRLGSGPRLVGWVGSGVRVSDSFYMLSCAVVRAVARSCGQVLGTADGQTHTHTHTHTEVITIPDDP